MNIEYVIGDLLEAPETIIVQGCNARGSMASGIAKAIMDRHPAVYPEYRRVYAEQGNRLDLGQIIPVQTDRHLILNAITQQNYGRDPDVVYVSYEAIETAIATIDSAFGDGDEVPRIAFPLIGAGLARGDWSIISRIIERGARNFQPVVYILRSDLLRFLAK